MALTKVSGSVLKNPLSLSGNVSVGGTLTYEDVTNVDAVGVITARSSIDAQGVISLAESIVHTGDTNTKISFPANDEISLDTSGQDRIYIKSDGKIGMGTVTPAVAIHHFSDGLNGNTLRLENREGYVSFTNDADILSVDANSHHFRNRAGSSEFARITSTGQLLIGVTSSDFKLHVDASNKAAEIGIDNSGTYKSALNTTNNANADFNIQHKTNLTSIGTGVNIPLCFHIGGGFAADSAEKMRLDTAGTLHIKGGNIEAGDDSFPLNFTDSISNYIGVAADGGSNNGDALFIAHSHGSGMGIFGYEAGGDRLVIATDSGGGGNKIDFILDAGTSGNTDNLNGKVPKMRIAANGVITLGSPTNTVLKAEVCNAVSGHQFISQCSDNNNGFEVYQQHGSTTTRNTFAVYANTGSGDSKEAQFRVRGDGKLYKGANQIYPLVNYVEVATFTAASVSSNSYTDLRTIYSNYSPKRAGNLIVIHHQSQLWQGGHASGSGDAMWQLLKDEGSGYGLVVRNERIMGNMDGRNYTGGSGLARHHRTVHLMGSFICNGNNFSLKTQGKVDHTNVTLQWYHNSENILQIWEYDKG